MNKKSTLLAAALMAVSSFMANAEGIAPDKCEKGNYYYLKTADNKFLSLDKAKADNVVIETFDAGKVEAKDIPSRDLALWEITKIGETGSYQIKNKKTKAVLSFNPESKEAVLGEGAYQWNITDGGLTAKYEKDKTLTLLLKNDKIVFEGGDNLKLDITEPENGIVLTADYLKAGFKSFKLDFGEVFQDNLLQGNELIFADDEKKQDFVTLQIKGKEKAENGTPLFIGVDTLSMKPSKATGAFGAEFKLDSVYVKDELHTIGNENFQKFKFKVNLQNDALSMYVLGAPNIEKELKEEVQYARVVYVSLLGKNYLTVGDPEEKGVYDGQGEIPSIFVHKESPVSNLKKGVYFLKSASKDKDGKGGQYIKENDGQLQFMDANEKPSKYQLKGQWYLRPEAGLYEGLYSLVDRENDSNVLLKGEVFKVEGMENTYTFGASADSITLEYQKDVNLANRYIGSAYYSKEMLAEKGYVLNNIPTGMSESNLYVVASEAVLKIENGDQAGAVTFKLDSAGVEREVAGALSIGDTIDIVSYRLKNRFSEEYITKNDNEQIQLGELTKATKFQFISDFTGSKYEMKIVDPVGANKYVSVDSKTSTLKASSEVAYFKLLQEEAPEYGSFTSDHKRFVSDGKSLTMNPLNFFAEAKQEGQDIILKSTYEKDNFSLWTIKSDASTPEKPLYFITTSLPADPEKPEGDRTRYYMASNRTDETTGNVRVKFVEENTIKDIKDSAKNPALFALKVTESGNYLLENQKEKGATYNTPYIGIINNVVVMTKDGVEFSVETAPAPVANEEIEAPTTVKVIGGVGEFSIRNAHGKKITVSNILGQTIATRIVSSDYVTVPTTRGVAIVSVEGDKAYKVIVK